jgi:hypothetical protein
MQKIRLTTRLLGVKLPVQPPQQIAETSEVEAWQRYELTDVTAKVVIYEAFVEGELEAPKHLARTAFRRPYRSGRNIPI